MRIFLTGCAGFIGSNLVSRLLRDGHRLTGVDDFSFGSPEKISHFLRHSRFKFYKRDLLHLRSYQKLLNRHDVVIHCAANSDILKGMERPNRDLRLNTLGTFNVLEATGLSGIKKFIFASSGTVYGESTPLPITENRGPLLPISLYGASKLACEGLCAAYSHRFNIRCWIFRFGNVLGPGMTHGILYDLVTKLKKNIHELKVLGNGKQNKTYVDIEDLMSGLWFAFRKANQWVNLFNLSSEDSITVHDIAILTRSYCGLPSTRILFQKQERGWPGDVTQSLLDCSRLRKLGWNPKFSSRQAVERALQNLCK